MAIDKIHFQKNNREAAVNPGVIIDLRESYSPRRQCRKKVKQPGICKRVLNTVCCWKKKVCLIYIKLLFYGLNRVI